MYNHAWLLLLFSEARSGRSHVGSPFKVWGCVSIGDITWGQIVIGIWTWGYVSIGDIKWGQIVIGIKTSVLLESAKTRIGQKACEHRLNDHMDAGWTHYADTNRTPCGRPLSNFGVERLVFSCINYLTIGCILGKIFTIYINLQVWNSKGFLPTLNTRFLEWFWVKILLLVHFQFFVMLKC